MADRAAPLDSLLSARRYEWSLALLERNPDLKPPLEQDHSHHGQWHSTTAHTCADGFFGTAIFDYGEDAQCARCGVAYCPACDDTL